MKAPEFWTGGRGPWPAALSPLACLYTIAGRARRALAHPVHAAVPVICVGNLTAGGTGKTPVVIAIARMLAAHGRAVHLLTRGYGGRARGPLKVDPAHHGASGVGDEALLLAHAAPTWVARDRAAGARAAVAAGAEAIVMDDGFQNPGLAKDLSLVVVDGETGFGNGRVMPAGPLREPVTGGLRRAQAVIVVGADRAGVADRVAAEAPSLPVLACRLAPAATMLAGIRVYGFAGIGRPDKFHATLREIGCEIAGFRAFPDHHPYTAAEVAELLHDADALGARAVTTAKDHVRLPAAAQARVAVVEVEAVFEDAAALDRLLAGVI